MRIKGDLLKLLNAHERFKDWESVKSFHREYEREEMKRQLLVHSMREGLRGEESPEGLE